MVFLRKEATMGPHHGGALGMKFLLCIKHDIMFDYVLIVLINFFSCPWLLPILRINHNIE